MTWGNGTTHGLPRTGGEPCPVDGCSILSRGQACPNHVAPQVLTTDGSCATCGVMSEEPDEEIQPGDYYTVDPTSPRRCPSCGMFPARESEGARRVAVARALADVCRRFCASDQHDDACIALCGAVSDRDRWRQEWEDADARRITAESEAWDRGHDECCAVYARHCISAQNPYRGGDA